MKPISSLTPSSQRPLHGKRILITAPRNYAARLSNALIQQGGFPILMPTIETCFLDEFSELDAVLKSLVKFPWLAFTSRHGIDAFFLRLEALNLSNSLLRNTRICAIGKDAQRLQEWGFQAHLIPAESSPTGILSELAKLPEIVGQPIIVPVPKVIGIPEPDVVPNFVAGLEQLGMQVTRVFAYQTQCLARELYPVELNLLEREEIDVIAFSSTAEIEAFLSIWNRNLTAHSVKIACFGPYTAANAQKLGFPVDIVAEYFSSFEGYAAAIAQFLSA